MTESLKLKSEENEKLCLTVRNLEDLKRDYENKLQGIPQLHERINHLEKKSKTRVSISFELSLIFIKNISPANNVSINVSKDTSTIGYGIENLKKLDVESEYKGISSKPEVPFPVLFHNNLPVSKGGKKVGKGIRSHTLHVSYEIYPKDFIKCFKYFTYGQQE